MTEEPRCTECGAIVPTRAAPGGICPRCLLRLGLSVPTAETDATREERSGLAAPARVGPYRLREKLGEGGMGVVFRADQEEPIRRQVALKLIKPGMDTREVIARFEAERQALAMMNHPNIARAYEAGATEQGRLYFVLEYVQGLPITQYCDRDRLATNERLELFMQVCAGVQHAHQKGIIHRDIKPSNVLVGLEDGLPTPKIIDFGVARATEQRLNERSMFTQMGVLIGTPGYMSPEQAELNFLDIDTRTDVYSLGALLYELLVGAPVFELEELRRVAFDEICRKIREDAPSKPSVRVSTAGASVARSDHRGHTKHLVLTRELRGDLDWITMKALEKDRVRRYASPGELAADIERHLHDEPVLAGPPSTRYRLGKFVRRHRVIVTMAAVLVVVLIAFGVTTTLQAVRLARERDRANQEATTAEEVVEFLVGLFDISDPGEARGREVTAIEVLDRGRQRFETGELEQPLVRARLLHTMGRVYRGLGLYESAVRLLQESVELRREQLGDEHPDTLASMTTLARSHLKHAKYAEAEALYRQVLETRRRILGETHPETLASMNDLGNTCRMLGRYKEAGALLTTALTGQRRILGEGDPRTVATMVNLGTLHVREGRLDEARPLLLEGLERLRTIDGEDHPDTLATMQQLAWLDVKQGRHDEAERLYLEIVEHRRHVLGEDHPDTLESLGDLGNLYRIRGNLREAEELLRETLQVQRRVLEETDRDLASTMVHLALVCVDLGRLDDAAALLREAFEALSASVGAEHPHALLTQTFLADVRARQSRFDEAESLLENVLATQERMLGRDHPDTVETRHKIERLRVLQRSE